MKRTTATAVVRVYEDFLRQYPSMRSIESASEDELIDALSDVGLQRQRARSIKAMAKWVLDKYGGEIPADLADLMSTPGLGLYSASAIACFGFGARVPIVDSNVERIITRVFGDSFAGRPSFNSLQQLAQSLLPDSKYQLFNYGLLDLGRLVCRPVRPRCFDCPLNSICDFFSASITGKHPGQSRGDAQTIAYKLRNLRIQSGLSLNGLAMAARVSKLTVINIEAGRTKPMRATVSKLASALNVDPKELSEHPTSACPQPASATTSKTSGTT